MDYDLKIAGGTLIDGSGAPRRRGDVGIRNGRVVALGSAPGSAAQTLDADGRTTTRRSSGTACSRSRPGTASPAS